MTSRILNTEDKNTIAIEISNDNKNEIELDKDELNAYFKTMWQRRSRMQCLSN